MATRVQKKTKEAYLNKIAQMNNKELYAEFISVSQPDDYDGCWTNLGVFLLATCEEELITRLNAVNFFGEFTSLESLIEASNGT